MGALLVLSYLKTEGIAGSEALVNPSCMYFQATRQPGRDSRRKTYSRMPACRLQVLSLVDITACSMMCLGDSGLRRKSMAGNMSAVSKNTTRNSGGGFLASLYRVEGEMLCSVVTSLQHSAKQALRQESNLREKFGTPTTSID